MNFDFDKKCFVNQEIEPTKLAIVGVDEALTWKEFEQRTDTFCTYLKANNVGKDGKMVLVFGHKNANMIVCFYACIKLGITYVPIDELYPADRIIKIVSITESAWLFNTTTTVLNADLNVNEVMVSQDKMIFPSNFISTGIANISVADPIIYTIFTSGSTGEPKGVQITSEAIQSFARWMSLDFGFSKEDVFINTAILSFDLSVFEVITFAALGATILLNDKDHAKQPLTLIERIVKYKGSVWVSTPSFSLMYARLNDERLRDCIKTFLFCGEVLPSITAKNLLAHYPTSKIYNTYGPTEATVATTLVEITSEIVAQYDPLPLGMIKREAQLQFLDGEIVILGPHVSIGYLNNDALNQQKFYSIEGQRSFRTGDFGFMKDDMLFFNGRKDDLIKLNGFRIELNEITGAINNLDYVLHGETIALRKDGVAKKIVSLIHFKPNVEISDEKVRTDLSQTLPHYMIPSAIKQVDMIPLNANGKADKKKLEELFFEKRGG